MIIVPDSNILMFIAEGMLIESHKRMGKMTEAERKFPLWKYYKCKNIWEANAQKKRFSVVIPDWIKVEAQGGWLQKNIDFSNYSRWRRERGEYWTKAESLLLRPNRPGGGAVGIGYYLELEHLKPQGVDMNIYEMLMSFAKSLVSHPIPQGLVEHRQKVLRELPQEASLRQQKILDGIDAIIMALAILLALRETKETVVLLTEDYAFADFVNYYHIQREAFPCGSILSNLEAMNLKELEQA